MQTGQAYHNTALPALEFFFPFLFHVLRFGGQNDTTNGGNLQSGQGLVRNMIEQMFGTFIVRNYSFLLHSDF